MSKFLDEMMASHNVSPEQVHLPTGGVAVFGRSGTGKSSLFYHSRFVGQIVIADTGSLSHKLFARNPPVVIDSTLDQSPIQQVKEVVERCHREGCRSCWTASPPSRRRRWRGGSGGGRGARGRR